MHFLGSAVGDVLAHAVARQSGCRVRLAGPLAFRWSGNAPATLAPPDAALLERVTRDRAALLARRLGNGPYNGVLPRGLVERFAVEALDPVALAATLAPWKVRTDLPADLAEVLEELAGS